MAREVYVGTAGWSVPKDVRHEFPADGSVLQRYAGRFECTEINSTFYRSHRPSTFERWAASVPAGFRFSLKMPKAVTHERRLTECEDLVDTFLRETAPLAEKRAVILVQLPPKLALEREIVEAFWAMLRNRTDIPVVCEPRHPTWFSPEAESLLRNYTIARVAADPAIVPEAAAPGADESVAYYRLHGAPRTYYSEYGRERLESYAAVISSSRAKQTWCIFDNTASGAATTDALALQELLKNV